MDKRKENEQLSEDVKSAQKELKNTRKKLEEALVVGNWGKILKFMSNFNVKIFWVKFKHFEISNLKQVPCYSAALLSPRPVSIITLHITYFLQFIVSSAWHLIVYRQKLFCFAFDKTGSLQGAAERAEKQGKLEKKELQEKLESIEAQMQVVPILSSLAGKYWF